MEFAAGSVAGALLLTTLAGAATVLGAASAFFLRRTNTRVLSVALGFSGGVMIYISFVELSAGANRELREVFGGTPGAFVSMGAFFGGMLLAAGRGLRYIALLLAEIIKANFAVIGLILKKSEEVEPQLVRFTTELADENHRVLLADSITLTPGTITVELEGGRYLVHCLDKTLAEGIERSSFVDALTAMEYAKADKEAAKAQKAADKEAAKAERRAGRKSRFAKEEPAQQDIPQDGGDDEAAQYAATERAAQDDALDGVTEENETVIEENETVTEEIAAEREQEREDEQHD